MQSVRKSGIAASWPRLRTKSRLGATAFIIFAGLATLGGLSLLKGRSQQWVTNPSDYVDQFIGTANGGHVFAGATMPFGSVKAVADCESSDNQAGFVSDGSPIRGISALHDDGTGGAASLGQFKVLPQYCSGLDKCLTAESERAVPRINGSEKASPGYFSIGLGRDNITAEVTVTDHAILHRFTFNDHHEDKGMPTLLFDLTNDLSHSFQKGIMELTRMGGTTRVTGGGTFAPSFGHGNFQVYFCLDVPNVDVGAWYDYQKITPITGLQYSSFRTFSREAGILLSYNPATVKSNSNMALARLGVSWTSSAKACTYASAEIPDITSAAFDNIRAKGKRRWDNTLNTIQVDLTGVSRDLAVNFWSSLYRNYIAPVNITGDNPLWESKEPYWDSYYCIWDSFRVVHPLLTITQREAQAQIVRAIIDIWRHEGFLPDCRMSLSKGFTQGGSNADNLLSDSFVKGIKGGINWYDALQAMIKDATVTPPDWLVEGRGGIENRKKLGYVPVDDTTPGGITARSASRTLEYAFNDFGIALVAHGLSQPSVAVQYHKASGDWFNLWNTNTTDSGFSGFIEPRFANGKWHDVDPRRCSPVVGQFSCFLDHGGGEFYEASSWEYSFFVPQDMASLVEVMGGPITYVNRLDALFDKGFHDIGDEPGFLHCYLYNYAGRPEKTVDRVLEILRANYATDVAGLPGNDDSGAMGAFVVFACFGFYPVAGTSVYLLSSPLLPTVNYPTSSGRRATITTVNFDGASVNKYIVSAKLNGKPYTKNWFTHDDLFGDKGGILILTLGPEPSSWGTAELDLPPSGHAYFDL